MFDASQPRVDALSPCRVFTAFILFTGRKQAKKTNSNNNRLPTAIMRVVEVIIDVSVLYFYICNKSTNSWIGFQIVRRTNGNFRMVNNGNHLIPHGG